ncbi:FAD-dependent oxidoreductase [Bacteroidia bacterium]|nr:FAD-dependent oxidoreductase [Bacteroidia bacterium]
MIYDIIFIGAGFSNLAASNQLYDLDFSNFLILEKGHQFKDRNCRGESTFSCKQCAVCNTTEGVGGANALHGNKLCYFPASKHIAEDFSLQDIDKSLNYLSVLLKHYFDNDFNLLKDTTKCQTGYSKKYYFSDVYFQNDFAKIVKMLTCRIEDKIIEKQNVCSIIKHDDFYSIETEAGYLFKTKHIVFGTGRTSYNTLPNLLKPLGAKFSPQAQDIGIRIETDCDYFTETYRYQPDPKIKFDFGILGSSRTFCAHNKGKVVPVRFGKSFFADGAFSSEPTAKNNIAIMTRVRKPLSNKVVECWMQKINKLSSNTLLLGNIVLDDNFIANFKRLIPSFPTKEHEDIMIKTLNHLLYGKDAIIKKGATIAVYAPAIDLQWLKPQLKKDFSLHNDDNIYVIGDAAGKSRGFIQALFSGSCWANTFLDSISLRESSLYSVELVELEKS